jgi:hypothetical protein
VSLFPVCLRRVGHCAPNDQLAPTGSRIEPAEPGPTVLSTPSPVKAPGLTLGFRSRSEIAFSRSRSNRGHLDAPHRGFAAAAAASGVVLGQAIELLQVRLEPEGEPGDFPPKRAGPRAHPRRLVDLFGEVRGRPARPVPPWRRAAASRGRAFAHTPLASPIRTGRSRTDGRTRRRDGERGDGGRARGPCPGPRHRRAGGGAGTRSRERDATGSAVMRDPSTGARLTGSLLSAAGAR